MNEQPLPTNGTGAGEVPQGGRPEGMQPMGGEMPAQPELSPQTGAATGGQPTGGSQQRLSPADVAAAIAAVPGGPPQVSGGGVVPTPVVAGDVDVIEPEWVNKAEEQVRLHAGDPHGEEEAIEELQEDYLQKRYGLSVGDPNTKDKDQGGSAAGKPGAA